MNDRTSSDRPGPLSDSERDQLNELLVDLRQKRQQEIENHKILTLDPQQVHDLGEESVNSQNAEIASGLREHAFAELTLIDTALDRLAAGSYGTCIDCGKEIGFARLQAYPTARRCIACKQVYEQTL